MKKTILLFITALLTFSMQAAYIYDATCFESDFNEANLPDGVAISTEGPAVYPGSKFIVNQGKMTVDFGSGIGQYKNVLLITFATPLDLSANAKLLLQGFATNTLPSTPNIRVRVRLYDTTGAKGPSDAQIWNTNISFQNSGSFNKIFDFSGTNFKNNLDLTKINKIQIETQDAGPLTGNVTFDKIKLGVVITPPILGYVDDFKGPGFSDPSVTFTVDGGASYNIANNKLNFAIKNSPGWGQIAEFSFANLIDMSQNKSIQLTYDVAPSCGFQVRFIDATGASTSDSQSPIFWASDTKEILGNTEIDWSKVKNVRLYDKGAAGGNIFAISYIRVGQDISVAVEDLFEQEFFVYPTTAKDIIYLTSMVQNAIIYNITGTKVISVQKTNTIDVSSLPKGVYLIRSSTYKKVVKFTKE